MKFPMKQEFKIELTKELIEKQLGYEIENFTIEPVYDNEGKYSGISINVVPKESVEFITLKTTLLSDLSDDDKLKLN